LCDKKISISFQYLCLWINQFTILVNINKQHSTHKSFSCWCSSYEDSLQSMPNSRKLRDPTPMMHHHISLGPPSTHTTQRRSRNRSITEDILDAGGLRQIQNMSGMNAGPSGIFMNGPSALRRSTERLMMVGTMHN